VLLKYRNDKVLVGISVPLPTETRKSDCPTEAIANSGNFDINHTKSYSINHDPRSLFFILSDRFRCAWR
jgi:hypothetical protein